MTKALRFIYRNYPCDGCEKWDTCENPETALKSVINLKVETGCRPFVEWVRSPLKKKVEEL